MPSSSAVIGQRFAFSHGRTGVLQQWLLNGSDIDRLLGSHDRKETEQILTELRFTKAIDQSLRDADAILAACNAWIRRETADMCPDNLEDVFNILWLAGDQPLLSYLIKKRKGLTSAISREPSPPFSAYPVSALRALVEENAESGLPEGLVHAIRSIRDDGELLDPRMIDTLVAQHVAEMKLALARKSRSRAIRRFVEHTIDIQNIRTVLRFREQDRLGAQAYLLEGGTVNAPTLEGSDAHIAAVIRQAGLYSVADAIERGNVDRNMMERLLSDVLAEDISMMWNTILRIEPLFAFAATALNQLSLLRVILIGKRNGLSPQEIKKILPPFLSASHYLP